MRKASLVHSCLAEDGQLQSWITNRGGWRLSTEDRACVHILPAVVMDKSLILPEPQFPCVDKVEDNSLGLVGLGEGRMALCVRCE